MLTQLSLTTAESKKLIASAVYNMPSFQKALKDGIIVIHPSSTTSFVFQQITGEFPEDGWVNGMVAPCGMCRSRAAVDGIKSGAKLRKQWIFVKGQLQDDMSMDEAFSKMGSDDIFVKGCTAIDSFGNAAVLSSNPDTGGTSGKIKKARDEKGFKVIIPTGLEKCIQGNLQDISKVFSVRKPEAGNGLKCGIFPVSGDVVTEITALKLLFGVDSLNVSCGGIEGAEGAVTLFFDGTEEKSEEVLSYFSEEIQGTVLPPVEYVAY